MKMESLGFQNEAMWPPHSQLFCESPKNIQSLLEAKDIHLKLWAINADAIYILIYGTERYQLLILDWISTLSSYSLRIRQNVFSFEDIYSGPQLS